MSLNILFMGTPEFAVPTLEALIASEHHVVGIYCQPPRPAGRGQKLRPSPVQQCGEKHEVPVYFPVSLKDPDVQKHMQSLGADVAVVAAYGLLLPKVVLEMFPHGCINVHPSKLPRWRGAAPIHRTVLAGDTETSICIMQMDEGLDTGDILLQKPFALTADITTGALHDQLATEAGPLVLETLSQIENGKTSPTPQSEEGVTYAQKIDKAEAMIDWQEPAEAIERKIRGLFPYPVATTSYGDTAIKIRRAEIMNEPHKQVAGTLVDDQLLVACGEGAIRILEAQRAGGKALPADEFLRGFPIPKGAYLA